MNSLNICNQDLVYHVSPLHYLVFILRSKQLLSKTELLKMGYSEKHFRSTSGRTDIKRGFSEYVHCSNKGHAPILKSKLSLGYPHVEYVFSSSILSEESYLLCRYNIAKNRGLFQQSLTNGYCYNGFKIPVAKSSIEKQSLLRQYGEDHIEILVRDSVPLPDDTVVRVFREDDLKLVHELLNKFSLRWKIVLKSPKTEYIVKDSRVKEVSNFLERSAEEPTWFGSGLEYDR